MLKTKYLILHLRVPQNWNSLILIRHFDLDFLIFLSILDMYALQQNLLPFISPIVDSHKVSHDEEWISEALDVIKIYLYELNGAHCTRL
jgi:hypothetical protein